MSLAHYVVELHRAGHNSTRIAARPDVPLTQEQVHGILVGHGRITPHQRRRRWTKIPPEIAARDQARAVDLYTRHGTHPGVRPVAAELGYAYSVVHRWLDDAGVLRKRT